MRIAYNPLKNSDGDNVGALTSAPNNTDITFDLPGKNIYARGVKFKGSDHTYTFSNDNNLTLTETPTADEGTSVLIGIDLEKLREALLSAWDIEVNKASYSLTTSWTDSEVDITGLSPGIFAIHINYQYVHYSGTFSYQGNNTNTDDEIILHANGVNSLDRGRVYAKIAPKSSTNNTTTLWLALSKEETSIELFNIKIKQIAKL